MIHRYLVSAHLSRRIEQLFRPRGVAQYQMKMKALLCIKIILSLFNHLLGSNKLYWPHRYAVTDAPFWARRLISLARKNSLTTICDVVIWRKCDIDHSAKVHIIFLWWVKHILETSHSKTSVRFSFEKKSINMNIIPNTKTSFETAR